ncbi:MAG: hypothetical protein NZM38_03625 [Cytophagales bacterium]|nr:hypothetical protein [Cytophagales bacterium]MDW8383842.1 hypothetical protein [Flammeovirgaceae bacterium]
MEQENEQVNSEKNTSSSFLKEEKVSEKKERYWIRKAKNEAMRKERMRFYPYVMIFNSFAIYVSINIILLYLHELIGAFFAYQQKIPVKLFYHYFTFEKSINILPRNAIILIFGFPPFLFFLGGLVLLYAHLILERNRIPFRLVFIWAIIIIFNIFFANLVYSFFMYKGLAIATEWFYISRFIFIPLMIIGFIFSIILGKFLSVPFMKMAPSVKLNVHKKPRGFIFRIAVIPFLLGASFIILSYPKRDLADFLIQFCIGLSVLSAWIFAKPHKEMKLVKHIQTNEFSWIITLIFIFCVLFMYIAIYNPINLSSK